MRYLILVFEIAIVEFAQFRYFMAVEAIHARDNAQIFATVWKFGWFNYDPFVVTVR